MGRGIGKFLRETIGLFPTLIIVGSLLCWSLHGYYRSWREGETFEFFDWVVVIVHILWFPLMLYLVFSD